MRSLVPALSLLCVTVANAQTLLGSSTQAATPARLITTHHTLQDALAGATLRNCSGKTIVSYRVGWALSKNGQLSLHEGPWAETSDGVREGGETEVPSQSIPLDRDAHLFLFYVAEIRYFDGTEWSAEAAPILAEAKSRVASTRPGPVESPR